jgi:hypothetical protein
MDRIPTDVVEAMWDRMAELPASEAPGLVKAFEEQQPAVLAYLMAAEGDELNQEERELLLFLGLTVWQIMTQGTTAPPFVSAEMLQAAETRNLDWLESLEQKANAHEDEAGIAMVTSYAQPDVLRGVLEALMEEDTGDPGLIRDESKGLLLLSLKTVIDCLDA